MFLNKFLVIQVLLLLLVSLAKGYQQHESKHPGEGTSPKSYQSEQTTPKSNYGSLLNQDKTLSPVHAGEKDDIGLVEVKEDEIPEGSPVYVLEEPENRPTDMEIMQTANNIVFRPLFRYRGKQEALRRNGQRVRRRYFVPRRSYRQTHRYPYYYRNLYY